MGKQPPVRIGPDMPDLPTVNERDIDEASAPTVQPNGKQVVREEKDGIVVETIISVQGANIETPAQLQAREKKRYEDTNGLTIVEY